MKKITLITLVLLLTCLLTAQAGPIDQQKARQLAAQFMQKKGLQLKGEPRRAPGVSGTGSNEAQPLYIFNADGAKGFVIVAGDDRADAILGYSTEGSYDEQNLPDNFRYYLQLLSSNMQALMTSDATVTTRRTVETHKAIAPLIKTKWDQGSATEDGYIYNTACPVSQSLHCLTGCVATAGAQIMYYYQHPASTKGVDGYQIGEDASIDEVTLDGLPATTFDWDIMKRSYNNADQGTASQQEVAKLMLYAGFAAQMNYGTMGSGASTGILAEGMANYFDYNPDTWQYVKQSDYSVSDWDSMMYNELENGRPIIYSGASKKGGGHAFICDGYDGEGLYHFNWGWSGQNNGYFKLAATNPYAGDGSQRDGYVNDIDAIIGLQRNNGETITKSPKIYIFSFEIGENSITMNYQNISDVSYAIDCGIALLNDDGSVKQNQLDYYPCSSWGELRPNYYWRDIQFNLATYLKEEGTYKVAPVFRLADETEWKRCMPSQQYFEVVIAEDKTMTIIKHPTVELEATQIEVPSNKIETLVQQVDVTVESKSDDYQGPLYLFASKTKDKGAYTYLAGTAIEGGASDVVTFYFTPATAGTWNLWIATDEAGNDIIGQATAEIGEAPTENVSFQVTNKDVIMGEDNATIVFSVQNTSETTSYREFYVWLYKADDTPIDQKPTSAITIEQGKTKDVPVTFDGLEDGVTYNVVYGYYSNVKGTNLWWLDDYEFTFEASTTAITLPEADTTADDTFYTLNGQRMSGRPNKAGIYIHKGKKVIVR